MNCEISNDRDRLDLNLIHQFLSSSYWASKIPLSVVEKSIQHSLCFGAYADGRQIGFARVVTDYATFAYLADVFVLPEHRGQGVGRSLVRSVIQHPELQHLRRWLLATRDAHNLYAQCGFTPLSRPGDFMTIHRPQVYEELTPA